MKTNGTVTIERAGRTYAASFTVERGMVHVETHTETRSVELGDSTPEEISRRVLDEIIDADLKH